MLTNVINRTKIQSIARGFVIRRRHQRLRKATLAIQRFAKTWVGRTKKYRVLCATKIQSIFRGHAYRLPTLFAKASIISYESALEIWSLQRRLSFLEDASTCPITQMPIKCPVLCLQDGHKYEKRAILQWLRSNNSSPITREPVYEEDLVDATPAGFRGLFTTLRETRVLLMEHVALVGNILVHTAGSPSGREYKLQLGFFVNNRPVYKRGSKFLFYTACGHWLLDGMYYGMATAMFKDPKNALDQSIGCYLWSAKDPAFTPDKIRERWISPKYKLSPMGEAGEKFRFRTKPQAITPTRPPWV
jgi:hypothetical protein